MTSRRLQFFEVGPGDTCLVLLLTLLIIPLAAGASEKPVIGSTTITLYPLADSYVDSEDPVTNHGDDLVLSVGLNDSRLEYAYFMFDLTDIPPDAIILSSGLAVHLTSIGGYTSLIGAHYCPDTGWTEVGVNWNSKPDFSPEATYTIGFSVLVWLGYYVWDVTPDVEAAVGIGRLAEVLKIESSGLSTSATFGSREGDNTPRLTVEYVMPPIHDVHLESVQDTGEQRNELRRAIQQRIHIRRMADQRTRIRHRPPVPDHNRNRHRARHSESRRERARDPVPLRRR
jgi:hypothetical protein